jgi:UDP-2,3-diacylglucosamine hydrolase
VALYLLSDVHLRLDRPERGRRLARLVESLGAGDRLVVVGDLCDFWFASRQIHGDVDSCAGLRCLKEFGARGGGLTLLPGNHDAWLGAFYEQTIGVGYAGPSVDLAFGGIRIHATHGHLLGARSAWKGWMEGRAFLKGFTAIPGPMAGAMGRLLDSSNDIHRDSVDRKHLTIYRAYADRMSAEADLCIFGHIHRTYDDPATHPRLVVLGGWHHRTSYFRVDEETARLLVIEGD